MEKPTARDTQRTSPSLAIKNAKIFNKLTNAELPPSQGTPSSNKRDNLSGKVSSIQNKFDSKKRYDLDTRNNSPNLMSS